MERQHADEVLNEAILSLSTTTDDRPTVASHSSFDNTAQAFFAEHHRKLAITLRHPKLRVLPGCSHCARVTHVLQRPQSLAALTVRLATKKFTRPRRAGCRAVSIRQLPYDLVGTIEEHLHHRADRSIF